MELTIGESFMVEAVAMNTKALQWTAAELKMSKKFMACAVSKNPSAMEFVPDEWKGDR